MKGEMIKKALTSKQREEKKTKTIKKIKRQITENELKVIMCKN